MVTIRDRLILSADTLSPRDSLPRGLAPLPKSVEHWGLRLAPVIIGINLLGTVFGFWYYGFHPLPLSDPVITWQLGSEPLLLWPFVPDSPLATLFIALALWRWYRGNQSEYLSMLAFFGCWKLGLWTPYVLGVFAESFLAVTWFPLYVFLFVSHLGMVLEAFVLHRIASFRLRAIGVALVWYGLNDILDYFVPVVGSPHHTSLPLADSAMVGGTTALQIAAAGAVTLTYIATFLACGTRIAKVAHS